MPVLPISAIDPGWHEATIEGFTYRPSTSNGNPMIEVDITLDSGELTSVFLLVTQDGTGFVEFLTACGEAKTADALRRKRNPAFELDDLIGRKLYVLVPVYGTYITKFSQAAGANAQRR